MGTTTISEGILRIGYDGGIVGPGGPIVNDSEFEMNPATGLTAGAPWTLRIFVVNEGEKPIRIQGVQAVTQVNGSGGATAVAPRTRQVPTQQRLLVGEHTGTWQQGTNAWSTQVTITANKGDSLRASVTWR